MKKVWFLAVPLLLGGIFLFLHKVQPTSITKPVLQVKQVESINTLDISDAVNKERVVRGLGALAINNELNSSAQDKCLDMQAKNYWSHNAPDGTEPWVFIHKYTKYIKAGENLAYGFATSADAVTGWMNSPGHKRNILDSAFTQVGYGICDFRGTKLIVQHFTN